MDKKNYMKPTIMVVKLHQWTPVLLNVSYEPGGYIPGMAPEEQNKLA